jgi:hypothetical protein
VTAVSNSAATNVVSTVPATLEDAVPSGSLDVTLAQAPAQTADLRRPLLSNVACKGSGSASIKASASVGLGIHFVGTWSWLSGLQSASLTGSANAQASATAQVQAAGSCSVGPVQIAQLKGPGMTAWVGPVPVVITSQLLIDIEGSISSQAQLTTGISGGYSATAGIGWTKGGGFYGIHHFGPSFSWTAPTINASADVSASIDPTIQVSIDGGGHADLNLSAGIHLQRLSGSS